MKPESTEQRWTAILLLIALLIIHVTDHDPALAESLGAAAGIVGTLYEVTRSSGWD